MWQNGSFRPSMEEYLRTSRGRLTTWVRARPPYNVYHTFKNKSAPEYALDEQLVTASDMYSLGCLVYAVHCKGSPPFKNHGSLGGLRENCSKPIPGMERLESDLQGKICRFFLLVFSLTRPCGRSSSSVTDHKALWITTFSGVTTYTCFLLVVANIYT